MAVAYHNVWLGRGYTPSHKSLVKDHVTMNLLLIIINTLPYVSLIAMGGISSEKKLQFHNH